MTVGIAALARLVALKVLLELQVVYELIYYLGRDCRLLFALQAYERVAWGEGLFEHESESTKRATHDRIYEWIFHIAKLSLDHHLSGTTWLIWMYGTDDKGNPVGDSDRILHLMGGAQALHKGKR